MAKRPAFTLLEVLIAMTLSCLIIFGVMQLYQGLVRYIESARAMMNVDRQTCLFFNQLERDLATAYIPTLAVEIKPEKEGAQSPATISPEEQKKREQKIKEDRKKFFVASIDERAADIVKIGRQKVELLKYLSFICSNPLHIYGEKRQQLVRVVYELVLDKAKSTRDEPLYKLMRRETTEMANVLANVDEFAAVDKRKIVRSYVLLDNVKGLFIEYMGIYEEKKDKDQPQQQQQPDDQKKPVKKAIRSFKWGYNEQTQGFVPEKAMVWLDLMNESKTKKYRFHALFPVLSFPTEEQKKTGDAQQQQAPGAGGQQPGQPVQQAQPGQPVAAPGLKGW